MSKEEGRDVAILQFDIKENKDNVYKYQTDDSYLAAGTGVMLENLKEQGVEIWAVKDNIIVSENGYHVAQYADEVFGDDVEFELEEE